MFFILFLLSACQAVEPHPQLVYIPPTYGQENIPSQNPHDYGANQNTFAAQAVNNFQNVFREKVANPIHQQTKENNKNIEGYKEKAQYYLEKIKKLEALQKDYKPPSKKVFEKETILSRFKSSKIINPSEIPDEPLDVVFMSRDQALVRIYQDLYKIHPQFEKEKLARDLGLLSVLEADFSFSSGEDQDGITFKQMARDLLDIAIGLDPLTSLGRSAYELYTGKNFVTGQELSFLDQSLSGANLLSFGTLSFGGKLVKIGSKLSHIKLDRVKNAISSAGKFIKKFDERFHQPHVEPEPFKFPDDPFEILQKNYQGRKLDQDIWTHPVTGQRFSKKTFEPVEWGPND